MPGDISAKLPSQAESPIPPADFRSTPLESFLGLASVLHFSLKPLLPRILAVSTQSQIVSETDSLCLGVAIHDALTRVVRLGRAHAALRNPGPQRHMGVANEIK